MQNSRPLVVWREEVGRRLLNLDFEPGSNDPFRLSLDMVFAGDGVRAGRTRHTAGSTFRDKEIARADSEETWAFLIPRAGSLNIRHLNRDFDLAPGEATMVFCNEPGRVGTAKRCDYTGLVMPASAFRASGIDGGALIGRCWNRSNSALQLLRGYLACLERAPPPSSQQVRKAAANHIVELAALAAKEVLSGEDAGDGETVRSARLKLALDHIARHYTDAAMSMSLVAACQGVSERYLYRLLEDAGIQFTGHVNALRLDHAFKNLTSLHLNQKTVADIAFMAGFSDISHFNRLFRRRYDTTPTAIRTRHSASY
jgi:AraC-like DNA-binding protein